jgi:HPt (histidine-containing phosphotransfer) domain-containing protein
MEAAQLDKGRLDALRTLQKPGEPDVLATVFEDYRTESREHMLQVRQALAAGDAATLRQAAHSLKSSSASLGAMTFASICASIEAACKGGAIPRSMAAEVERAEAEYARVLLALDLEQGI